MNRNLLAVVVVLTAGALLFPTLAAPFTDEAPDLEGLVAEPSEGPNGVYAVEDSDGELAIRITGDNRGIDGGGINDGAVTVVPDIFTITNEANTTATVWIETAVADIEFVRGTDSLAAIDGRENSVTLAGGETVHVGVRIHAVGDHDVEQVENFEIVAVQQGGTDDRPGADAPVQGSDPTAPDDGDDDGGAEPDGDEGDQPDERDESPDDDSELAVSTETADGGAGQTQTFGGVLAGTAAVLLLGVLLGVMLLSLVRRHL